MKVTKRLRLEDLGLELRLLPQKISEASTLSLQMPWMEAAAKSFCPVDTGALLGSIRWEIRGLHEAALVAGGVGYVNPRTGRPVDYARYVHDGTSRMPARPFLLQAVIQERIRYVLEMFRKLAEAI
jgi:HK97 gp10 family phage protein